MLDNVLGLFIVDLPLDTSSHADEARFQVLYSSFGLSIPQSVAAVADP